MELRVRQFNDLLRRWAVVLVRVAGLARRDDIARRMRAAFRQRRDVILRQLVLKRSSAIRATVIEGDLQCDPLCGREVVDGGVGLSGSPSLCKRAHFVLVALSPRSLQRCDVLRIGSAPAFSPHALNLSRQGLATPQPFCGTAFIPVSCGPRAIFRHVPVPVFDMAASIRCFNFFWIVCAQAFGIFVMPRSVFTPPFANCELLAGLAPCLRYALEYVVAISRQVFEAPSAALHVMAIIA